MGFLSARANSGKRGRKDGGFGGGGRKERRDGRRGAYA
jgi:hypothetical protein